MVIRWYVRSTQAVDLYPTYDKTFWFIPQTNRLRRLCQKIVRPSGGERMFGTPPSDAAHTFFQLAIFFAVLGSVTWEKNDDSGLESSEQTDTHILQFCGSSAAIEGRVCRGGKGKSPAG